MDAALDESYDIVDEEYMATFVQFFYIESKTFKEELLAILPSKGKPHRDDLFKTFYEKMGSLSTDGVFSDDQ